MGVRYLRSTMLVTGLLLVAAGGAAAQKCPDTDYDCQVGGYNARIKANLKDFEAYYGLARALQNKGDYLASIAPLDTYITSGAPKTEYLVDGYNLRGFARHKIAQYELAVKDFTTAIQLFPTAVSYYDRGKSYASLKSYDLAITDHTKAISLDPKYTLAYFSRGFAYMEQKNNQPAIADFTKVIALDPQESEAYYNRGTIYYRQGNYALAIADLDRYIDLNRSAAGLMADGYLNRGLAHYYAGNATKAVDDYTRAIELAPRMKNAYTNRATAYRKLGKIALAQADEKMAATL